MTVGIKLGSITDEIGSSEFFFSFFSTIAGNLENRDWGTRFPIIMNDLYEGELLHADAEEALEELDQIAAELSSLPISKVIWDLNDPTKAPPWGENIAPHITSLENYFVTSTGRDLIAVLREIFSELRERGGTVSFERY